MKKFSLAKAPFLRSRNEEVNSTTRMMYDVVIALIPIIIFGWFINGLFPYLTGDIVNIYYLFKPLINILSGCFFSCLFEGLYFWLFLKEQKIKGIIKRVFYSYAIIPGLLLVLILPAYVPVYVIIFGCLIANIIFKMLFGGFGHNIFNPALIGYAFCFAAFGEAINDALLEQVQILNHSLKIVTSATPLTSLNLLSHSLGNYCISYEQVVATYGSLFDLFLGFKAGALGETCAVLCILGGLYLFFRKVIDWRIPVFYLGTVFVITWIIGIVNGISGVWFPIYNLLVGGILFAAFFMATEPVTTPKTPNGKIIYAIGIGLLTVLFRLVAGPEGVTTSILFMCLFTPIIDKFAAINRKPKITLRVILNYCFVGLIYLIIAVYTIYKTMNLG